MATNSQTSSASVEVVILAAGQGTRMRSKLPKVLHPLAGKPLLQHVLDTASVLKPKAMHVVIGHQADRVRGAIPCDVKWAEQTEQLGTGHAVQQALPDVDDASVVLVLYGDVPMVSQDTLERCVASAAAGNLGLITADFDDPAQLGRIIRNGAGAIQEIVEFKDASEEQRAIQEINSGIMALNGGVLKRLLSEVKTDNAQGEYYLTDTIALAVANNIEVEGLKAERPEEVTGVNDRLQLAELERVYQMDRAEELMRGGATLADPSRVDVRGSVQAGQDCFIDANVIFVGDVVLGEGVRIASGCVITDSVLGDNVQVHANTLVEGARVAADCALGPFARIRPGSDLDEGVKIGNFVELKKSKLGKGSKASHLTYIGDATIGADCNIGAGTVTCNYDGISKHKTQIGDRVFVGTNSTLVAPIEIAQDAFVAAGSTITTNVPDETLAVGRGKQRNINGWVRPDRRKS